jgi:hypothetical protein
VTEAANSENEAASISYWPTRPDGCPPSSAYPIDQDMFRFVKESDEHAWHPHVMKFGEKKYSDSPVEVLCKAHVLSVYPSEDSASKAKARRLAIFRNHQIVRFRVDRSMGLVSQPEDKTLHTSWWPSDSFAPPPSPIFVAQESQ